MARFGGRFGFGGFDKFRKRSHRAAFHTRTANTRDRTAHTVPFEATQTNLYTHKKHRTHSGNIPMALFARPFDVFVSPFDALGRDFWHHHHHHHRPAQRRRRHVNLIDHPFFHHYVNAGGENENADDDVFEISETDRGYLVTALVPGVAASEIEICARPNGARGGVLSVRSKTHPRVKTDLALASGLIDASGIAASCIDGVLRIVIPKIPPTEELVEVAAGAAEAEEDEKKRASAADRDIVINVPGFRASDVKITRHKPTERLVVRGVSKTRGTFTREYSLGDAAAAVSARCADGVLTIRVRRETPSPLTLPVSPDAPLLADADGEDAEKKKKNEKNADDADADADEMVCLVRRAVPGARAEDFAMDVDADGTLRARADCETALGRRRYSFATTVSSRIDRGTVRAHVADGILTVVAKKPSAPAKVVVDVSADAPAALTAATPVAAGPSTPDAAGAKTKAIANDDVIVEDIADDGA